MAAAPERKPKPVRAKPDADSKTKRLEDLPLILNWHHLRSLPKQEWAIPMFLPRPGTIMFAGPKNSGKSLVVLALGMTLAYGELWIDGSKLPQGMVFYVSNESVPLLEARGRAWLHANGKPMSNMMADNFKMLNVVNPAFKRQVERKSGRGTKTVTASRLDLLDRGSVEVAINAFKETADGHHLPTGMVILDNATSLVRQPLGTEISQILTEHMQLIADRLACCCILVNHTHRNDATKYQGGYPLATNLDGDFIVARDFNHTVSGQRLGNRTIVYCGAPFGRLKPVDDTDLAYEFLGTPVSLEVDGELVNSTALKCIGRLAVGKGIDDDAIKFLQIAERLEPGKVMALSALSLLVWGSRGGNQIAIIERVVPTEWRGVTLVDGEMRELMRFKKGTYSYVECRAVTPPPQTKEDPIEPKLETEVIQKKVPSNGKEHALIKIGTMHADDYFGYLDQRLPDEDRMAAFEKVVEAMCSRGAALDDELGEPTLQYVRRVAADTTVAGIARATKMVITCRSVREFLDRAVKMVRIELRKAKPKSEPKPPPKDEQPPAPEVGEHWC